MSVLIDWRSCLIPVVTFSIRPTWFPFFPFFSSSAIMSSLQPNVSAVVVELCGLSLGLLIQLSYVHRNLSVRSKLDVCAVHRTGRGAFEVHALAVVSAAVARALEFILRRLPVGSATQMRAARIDYEQAIRSFIHPDAILLLPLCVHAKPVILWIADFERCRGLKQSARQEEAEESQEPRGEKRRNHRPGKAPTLLIDFVVLGPDSGDTASLRSFGSSHCRSADIAN